MLYIALIIMYIQHAVIVDHMFCFDEEGSYYVMHIYKYIMNNDISQRTDI